MTISDGPTGGDFTNRSSLPPWRPVVFCDICAVMKTKSIRTIAGLQRLYDARNRRAGKLYEQPYIFRPALSRYLKHFDFLNTITDERERYQAFRHASSLEHELETVNASLSPQQRVSFAQQDRARNLRSRVTTDGVLLKQLITNVLQADPCGKKAKQYWIPFKHYLETMGLTPVLTSSSCDPSERLEYGLPGRRRHLSLRQFENYVSQIRRERFPSTEH